MLSLEQEIKEYLKMHSMLFEEGCDEFDKLDFCIHSDLRGAFHFDAKKKNDKGCKIANWPDIERSRSKPCLFLMILLLEKH